MSSSEIKNFDETKTFYDPIWGAAQLRNIQFFHPFSEEDLKDLYLLGEIKTTSAHSNIIIEGEPSRGLFIILSGTVSIYKNDAAKAKMMRLTYLESGSFFGELSLFDDAPRSATVVSESTCFLFSLSFERFSQFLELKGSAFKAAFYHGCALEMTKRFRKQNGDYMIAQELLWKHALKRTSTS